jgi:hypothetical protein
VSGTPQTVTVRIPGCGCITGVLAIIGFLYLIGVVG